MCQGLNSHYFHIIGDGHQPNSRVYIPIIRIPIKGGMTIPKKTRLLTMAHILKCCEHMLGCRFAWPSFHNQTGK